MAKVIDTGWVKLHRKIKEKGWYRDSEYVHLWVHLLLKANHSGAEYLNNGVIVKLKAGQMITGRKQLSIETGLSESKIERVLKCFQKDGEIEQQANSRNRLISIVSWETLQQSEQQVNNKRTADGQHLDTNKNDNNLKNEEELNKRKTSFYDSLKPFVETYGKEMLREFYEYWIEPNKQKTKLRYEGEKYFDIAKRLATWKRNEKPKFGDKANAPQVAALPTVKLLR